MTLGFLLSTTACATASPATEIDYGIQGVILSADRLRGTLAFGDRVLEERYGPYWTPSRGDVKDLTRQLLAFLQASDHSIDREILANLHDYRGQYYGVAADERRVLVLTAFCLSEMWHPNGTFEWKREIYWVTHGGRCLFEVQYDPTTRELVNYHVSPYPGRGPITLFGPVPARYPAPQGSGLFDSAERTITTMSRWGEWIARAIDDDPAHVPAHGSFLNRRQLYDEFFVPDMESVDGWNNELLFWVKEGHYVIVSFGSDGKLDQPYRSMGNLVLEVERRGELQDPRNDILLIDGKFGSLPAGVARPAES
jgi:hypothetical protein